MSDMEEIYKFEAETLRRVSRQCADLLFKYGHKFDKEDRDKAISLVTMIKNRQDFDDADSMRIAYAMKQIEELDNEIHKQA